MKTFILTQHADRNVSARDYNEYSGKIAVKSMFRTLQGEGRFAGWPAVFVRLAGCNYGSKTDFCGFCDTDFRLGGSDLYEVDDLVKKLEALGQATDILVITGGEPTLQTAALDLIVKAADSFAEVQIETNGTQPKFFAEAEARGLTGRDFVTVVSPKANERLGHYPPMHDLVTWWASDFKFVLSANPDSPHHTVPEWARASNKPVYVSPMTCYLRPYDGEVSSVWDPTLVDQVATAENYAYAAQYALKYGLRLSVQTHTFTAIP